MVKLTLLLLLSADPDAGCPWKDGKQLPKLEQTRSGAEVTYSADPTWFRCAKRAGSKLELIWSVGQGGELAPRPPVPLTTYSSRESVRELCATPGLKQVQAQLKGSGEMEKLDWSSSLVEVYCEKCQWAGDDNIFALHTRALTPPGTWTLQATYDAKWWACAKPGAEIELRVFTGATREEVNKATEPTHVVKQLGGPSIKKTFSKSAVCKGNPKYVGVEMGGSGEFRVLPAKGRSIQESQCQ